jgi:hypothetical protein
MKKMGRQPIALSLMSGGVNGLLLRMCVQCGSEVLMMETLILNLTAHGLIVQLPISQLHITKILTELPIFWVHLEPQKMKKMYVSKKVNVLLIHYFLMQHRSGLFHSVL